MKGVRDSLNEKVEKCSDLLIPFDKIQKIAEEIEIAMFGQFSNICDFAMFSCPNVYPHKIGTLRVTLIELHSNKIK